MYLWTQKRQLLCESKKNGYIALVSVLIISALVILIAVNAALFGIGEADMGVKENQSRKAYYFASLCAEQGLMTLRDGGTYSQEETLELTDGACTIYPIEGSWIVKTSATSSGQTAKIQIEISSLNPAIEITSWQEVSDFQ